MDPIDKKLDKISDSVHKIEIHMAEYNQQLKIHIKGVQLLEQRVSPIEKHVIMVQGAMKFVGFLAAAFTIIEIVLALRGH